MKKIIIALALTVAAATSFAGGSIGVEQERIDVPNSNTINGTAVTGSYDLFGFTADGRYEFGHAAGKSVKEAELGLTKSVALTRNLSVGLRGAVGRLYPQGSTTLSYFTVDPTVTYALNSKLSVTGGARIRNEFNGGVRTVSPLASVDYKLTPKDVVSVGYIAYRGKQEANDVQLSYKRLF